MISLVYPVSLFSGTDRKYENFETFILESDMVRIFEKGLIFNYYTQILRCISNNT